MGAGGSSSRARRHRSTATSWKAGMRTAGGGGEEERDQLAACLAFISDMALTGETTSATAATAADTGLQQADDDPAPAGQDAPVAGDAAAGEELGEGDTVDAEQITTAASAQEDEDKIPEPADSSGNGAGSSSRARWLRHRLRRLRRQQHRAATVAVDSSAAHALSLSVDDSVSAHIRMLNSMDSQEDDSADWAEMRSWLVWCLRDKLGDTEVLGGSGREQRRAHGWTTAATASAAAAPSRRSASTVSRGSRQLVRQQAVHERSPRIGIVDYSSTDTEPTAAPGEEPIPTAGPSVGRLMLRCRSAETGRDRRYDASLDSGGGDSSTAGGQLTVYGQSSRSGQSSFESYGSVG